VLSLEQRLSSININNSTVFVVLLGLVISMVSTKRTQEGRVATMGSSLEELRSDERFFFDHQDDTTVDSWRLPNTTIPTHYDLYISTDPEFTRFIYTGTVYISIQILETIDCMLYFTSLHFTSLYYTLLYSTIRYRGLTTNDQKGSRFILAN